MTIYDFSATDINGNDVPFSTFQGQVLLIVNTASRCGFTPQFKGLQQLYDTYHPRGFTVLGFPCNQFLGQDPGTNEEILEFCQTQYGVSFPMFQKIEVNGPNAHPLYQYLKRSAPGFLNEEIKWNFTKFLVDRNGNVVKRYAPTTTPESIAKDIEALL
jgi:glutathione peroxidase